MLYNNLHKKIAQEKIEARGSALRKPVIKIRKTKFYCYLACLNFAALKCCSGMEFLIIGALVLEL